MQYDQLVWDHFKFNAEQRLKGFNFFVLLSIFAHGGVFTAIQKELTPGPMVILGLFVAFLSTVFWLVDSRSRDLLDLSIRALKEIERSFPESAQLFAIDAREQGRFVRYTSAIRALLFVQLIFGVGVACYGVYVW